MRKPPAGLSFAARCTLGLTVFAASITPRPTHAAIPQDTLGKISVLVDSIVLRQMSQRQIDGAAVVVMANGRVLKSSGYGVANKATGEQVRPGTAFFVASITKAFTTATVLGLVQDGLLTLEDTVGALVPGLPVAWRGASTRQLLGMTSGVPESARDAQRGISWPDYQTAIDSAATKPVGARGARIYGGLNYVLLGKVVESVTKRRFADVVRAKIFTPLGLTSAVFGDWRVLQPGRAEWYSIFDLDKQDFSAKQYLLRTDYPSYRWPSAGMFINAEELATFVSALGDGRVLGPAMLEAYWQPVMLNDGKPSSAFLGSWDDVGMPGHVAFHEGGARAAVIYARDARLVIVVLTNLQGGLPIEWMDRILALYQPMVH